VRYSELATSPSEAKLVGGCDRTEFLYRTHAVKPNGELDMNWVFKSASAGAMVGSLAAPPFYPGQNQLVGVVLDAESAYVSKAPLTSGTSLYSADVVRTDSEGHVRLRVRQTRFQLVGQSEAAFFYEANGAVTELQHGTMVIALNIPSESFEVFVSDVRIIPKNDRPVLAEVTINAQCDLRIKVIHGNLEATAGKESKTIEKGQLYAVTPESMTHAAQRFHRVRPNTIAVTSTVHAHWLPTREVNLTSREEVASRKCLSSPPSV
jgi:hypothetical protein